MHFALWWSFATSDEAEACQSQYCVSEGNSVGGEQCILRTSLERALAKGRLDGSLISIDVDLLNRLEFGILRRTEFSGRAEFEGAWKRRNANAAKGGMVYFHVLPGGEFRSRCSQANRRESRSGCVGSSANSSRQP
eukprot:3936377-Rhodomonas_salina.1